VSLEQIDRELGQIKSIDDDERAALSSPALPLSSTAAQPREGYRERFGGREADASVGASGSVATDHSPERSQLQARNAQATRQSSTFSSGGSGALFARRDSNQ
jgi:hypothetical protein